MQDKPLPCFEIPFKLVYTLNDIHDITIHYHTLPLGSTSRQLLWAVSETLKIAPLSINAHQTSFVFHFLVFFFLWNDYVSLIQSY